MTFQSLILLRTMSVDHYENFPVASLLLPGHLRPAVQAIYAFARYADDIADEGDYSSEWRLQQLQQLDEDVIRMQSGMPCKQPLVGALVPHMLKHALPAQALRDLLSAFSQDVLKKRYHSFSELSDYCARSANPVGRLMLHLYQHGECPQPATIRFHMQRFATNQFLAGYCDRLEQRAYLSAAGRYARVSGFRNRHTKQDRQ